MKTGRSAKTSLGEQGMASIVVVSVLIVILTLISLGFARLISRASQSAANRQYSASASYAAQSAINDVAAYLKQYVVANPGASFLPKSTRCNGSGSLIGDSGTPGPFYNDSNLSGDTSRSTNYTCLLLDPTPDSLVYNRVPNLKSQVVKVNTSAAAGALDKLMISWQPSSNQITGYPISSSDLNDETTWNSAGGVCKDIGNNNASCIPMLRVSIYPISNGETLNTTVESQAKTVFLYPQKPGGIIPLKYYTDTSGDSNSFIDGSLIPVACNQNAGGNFKPSTSNYTCNIIIGALAGAIAPANTDSVYLRLTPIYNRADIQLRANDKFGDVLSFINDQAVIDATAQTGTVAKRLKAWVDISSLSNSSGINTNVSPNNDAIPEQALRTAIALCKRESLYTSSNGYADYIGFDDPDAVCHNQTITTDITPSTLAFSIIGDNGQDNGKRVCSTGDTPEQNAWGCTTNVNPDSPQNPVQSATVYVGTSQSSPGGNITLDWRTQHANTCTASGTGWSGDKSSIMTFSGTPATNGQGKQDITGINNYSEYDLQCDRPGGTGPTPLKKVYAWPFPQVSLSGSATAGQPYSISWTVANSTSCTASGDAGANGSWSGAKSSSISPNTFSQALGTWAWNDNSTRTYIITCKDPIGRTATAQFPIGPSPTYCQAGSPSCPGNLSPPNCNGDWNVTDNGNGTGTLSFNGACPPPPDNPLLGYYRFTDCSSDFVSAIQSQQPSGVTWNCGNGVGNSYSFTVGVGNYCANYWSGGDPWGWLHQSGIKCFTVYPPMVIDFNSNGGLWDQGPTQCSGLTGFNSIYNGTWWCRNGTFNQTGPGCADGVHRWTMCDLYWNVSGGSGNHTCTIQSLNVYYGTIHKGPENNWSSMTSLGWGNGGTPNPFNMYCTDNVTTQFISIAKSIP